MSPIPGGSNVVPYAPSVAPPYSPGKNALPLVRGGGRGWPQTFQNVKATNAADAAFATRLPPCASFSIAPAAVPTAQVGRSILSGVFPVTVFVQDESGSEVSPALVVTGTQVFRFGANCRGLRLQVSSLAAGTDMDYDVTIDPDPTGEWTTPGGADHQELIRVYSFAVPALNVDIIPDLWVQSMLFILRQTSGVGAVVVGGSYIPSDGSAVIANETSWSSAPGGMTRFVGIFGRGGASLPNPSAMAITNCFTLAGIPYGVRVQWPGSAASTAKLEVIMRAG